MIFSLVYKSKAISDLGVNQVQRMLEQARNFNIQNDITGCLLYHQGEFLQYIEGEEQIILNLFRAIKEDKRHSDIDLLSYDYIIERVFEDWEMAYEDFSSTKHQLQYLKLLVSLFVKTPKTELAGNPTSIDFWNMVKKLLSSEFIDK